MRHARLAPAFPVGLLALAVFLPSCRRGLVSAARCPQLLLPYPLSAAVTAIALAPITTRTDSEERVACRVDAPPPAEAFNG